MMSDKEVFGVSAYVEHGSDTNTTSIDSSGNWVYLVQMLNKEQAIVNI